MKANKAYQDLDPEFWANIKLLNQRLGYTRRKSIKMPEGGFVVPSLKDIKRVFEEEHLQVTRLIQNNKLTKLGETIVNYMTFRGELMTKEVKPYLMNKDQAQEVFLSLKKEKEYSCPLPFNKQKGEKKDYAYLTGIVNMLIESNKGNLSCDYDPKELTALTENNFLVRTLSRRVDGAFPTVIDPIAIWEIKDYYYTTTFGSRVADGVYETQLDGWELWEARINLGRKVMHYLIIDDYFTWWEKGRSYLCRIIDSLHMGLVTEVLFGRETLERLPQLVHQWKDVYYKGY